MRNDIVRGDGLDWTGAFHSPDLFPVGQSDRIGQRPQSGTPALQNSRPSETKLTWSENRNAGGIFCWSRSMSRGAQCPSFCVGRTHPSRRAIRQQWVSTGQTSRPRDYIITHLATFFPTPGNEVRNASQAASSRPCKGASVSRPKRSMIASQVFRIACDFCR